MSQQEILVLSLIKSAPDVFVHHSIFEVVLWLPLKTALLCFPFKLWVYLIFLTHEIHNYAFFLSEDLSRTSIRSVKLVNLVVHYRFTVAVHPCQLVAYYFFRKQFKCVLLSQFYEVPSIINIMVQEVAKYRNS